MHNRFWFLLSKKLSGTATDSELSDLDDLLMANAEWQYAVQHLSSIWDCKGEEVGSENDFEKHVNRMHALGHDTSALKEAGTIILQPLFESPQKRWLRPVLVSGFVVLAVVCAFWFTKKVPDVAGNNSFSGSSNNTIVTKSGSRSKKILPDGTEVWLNAESKLEYNPSYGKTNRDVKLSGEAYFDVVKNADMPFTIQTDKIHIKVTGTAFNVKAYPGEKVSETSLIRGRVEVTVNARPDEKYILKPNEKLVVRDEVAIASINKTTLPIAEKKLANEPLIQLGYLNYLENDSAAIETSWVYNRLIFDDESFSDIARKMERWYGVTIQIQDQLIASQQLTYTIRNETVAQALRNMQYALRFHYTINQNTITITK